MGMIITASEIQEEVRILAKENPGFRYSYGDEYGDDAPCKYLPDGRQSGCIIGQALLNLGISPEDIRPFEGWGVSAVLLHLEDVEFSERSMSSQGFWLEEVQRQQDKAVPWGEAITIADEKSEND